MEIGAKDIFIVYTFVAILFIITISIDNFAQRFFVVGEESPSLVILKAIVGLIKFLIVDFDVSDIAITILIKSIVAHDTQTFNSSARSFNIVLTQELKSATDGKNDTVCIDKFF